MTEQLTMLILLSIATLANVLFAIGAYIVTGQRLTRLQEDVSAVRQRTVPVDVGGRLPPSPAELQAARNRMDKLGIAHPGGPG